MFERNRIETQEQVSVAVEILLDDGSAATGKLFIAASRTVFDVLNGATLFLDFEPYEGERRLIAKSAIKAVKLLAGAKPFNLVQKVRDLDGFDPHGLLGVSTGASWDEVRAAYVERAKTYHPDRFANVDLPQEVQHYLSGMVRRVNAAYSALETAHAARRGKPSRGNFGSGVRA